MVGLGILSRGAVVSVLVSVLGLTALGCDGGSNDNNGDSTPSPRRPTATPLPAELTGELTRLMDAVGGAGNADGLLDTFWREAITDLDADAVYARPTAVRGYPPGRPIDTACTGDESGNQWNQNAYYCPSDQTVSWESNWFARMLSNIGELAPLGVFAHEWGHHIQKLTTQPAVKLSSENQADCYSGAFFNAAERNGWLAPYVGDPAIYEAVVAIYLLGNSDFVQSNWFKPDVYGPPRSRTLAFGTGYLGLSPTVCQLYQDFEFRDPIDLGWYTLDPPASFEVTTNAKGVTITEHGVSAEIIAYPDLSDDPAEEQFETVATEWLGLGDYDWQAPMYVDPFGSRLGGTAALRNYEQRLTDANGQQRTIHGFVVLHVDPGHGGVLLDIYVPGESPPDQVGWDEVNQWVAIIANGLCPGGHGTEHCPTEGGR